ncbi:hypothetical protein KL948_000573 [Ogataea haglerorum]|nr:hypothetical protein KL948_000573 [Ogataea haglerorum]KAG7772231.1 hypothetical protein KL931_000571 [Ogataea haglerorum]
MPGVEVGRGLPGCADAEGRQRVWHPRHEQLSHQLAHTGPAVIASIVPCFRSPYGYLRDYTATAQDVPSGAILAQPPLFAVACRPHNLDERPPSARAGRCPRSGLIAGVRVCGILGSTTWAHIATPGSRAAVSGSWSRQNPHSGPGSRTFYVKAALLRKLHPLQLRFENFSKIRGTALK